MSDVVKKVADPSGFFSGTQTTRSIFDPGGSLVKGLTGSDIASKIADPVDLFAGPEAPDVGRRTSLIADQAANERRRLAQSVSDVERKKALLTKRGGTGRSLLIKTSQTGVTSPATATLLGGTS